MSPPPFPANTALAFKGVTVKKGKVTILAGVTAMVPRGSCTAVVGPNGAGKTTLLNVMLKFLPYQGTITFGESFKEIPPRIGYVPQKLQIDQGLPITVLEFMVMGRQRLPLWFGVRKKNRRWAMDLLASVKAENLGQRRLGALSGGEMQRVLLALALGEDPDLLVLDEPASGIDIQGEQMICCLLDDLRHERGFTQIMVSHNLSTVMQHSTHVICLNRKVKAQGPPRDILTQEAVNHLFGLVLDSSSSCLHGKESSTASA